jgi:CubicO group peptidase (beta-lactamase class C family)
MIAAIRERLEKRATDGEFSGVVLVAHHDKILLESSYGFADREAKIPNTLETRFHLASAGKMFTAVAIAQLVSKGKLSYTDTVAKILPDYPNREVAEKVTVHQLLTHSAGLGTFFESPGFVPGRKYSNATEEMAVYKDEKLFFEPGTRWRYSNAGFSLLGAIIERLSGKTYLEYVRENIFRPLKMKDTYSNVNGETDPHTSVFYTQSPTDPLGVEPYVPNRGLGASQGSGFGGGFSTAGDLFKFVRALRTNRLLGEKLTQQMISSAVNQDERGTWRSGYGIVESVLNGETIRGHSGGSRTDVEMLWNSDYTVIAQSNAFPLSVNVLSNEIIDFITTQNALRNKK